MTAEHLVAALADLPPGTVREVHVGGHRVCLANDAGEVFAMDGRCLHKGGSLGQGRLAEGVVTCPLHWWRYDIRTGAMCGRPEAVLATYPVRVEDGRILITLPTDDAQRGARHSWQHLLREHARTGPMGPHAAAEHPSRTGEDPTTS